VSAATNQAPLRNDELKGRARLTAVEDRILACVHCGFCLSVCPTYTRLGDEADSPRGRILLMRAVEEGRLSTEDPYFHKHIDQCVGCRACEPVCPSGVQYGLLLERARATITDTVGSSVPTRVLLWSFSNDWARAVVGFAGRLFRSTGLPRWLARRLPKRMNRVRFMFAMLATTTPWRGLQRITRGESKLRTAEGVAGSRRPVVAMLDGCAQDAFFPHVNRATAEVLEANACAVLRVSNQGCCGALHAHRGQIDRARELAKRNIASFQASGAERVIVNAAGCAAVMKEYGELLEDDPQWGERAREFSRSVRDISEFLMEIGPVEGEPVPVRVTWDAPCHLCHAQRIVQAPIDLLDSIPQLEHVPLDHADECCGGAGIYGLLHEELGGRILADKVNAILRTGADVVASANPGCIMQIGAGMILQGRDVPVVHVVELLAESYRRRAE